MGWDGYACRVQRDDWLGENVLERLTAGDVALPGFHAAALEVGLEHALEGAHVGSRVIARMLARATGEAPYNVEWWPDKVKTLAQAARWEFDAEPGEDPTDRQTARLFLELSASYGLGMRFD